MTANDRRTEEEKMLAGDLYIATDPDLTQKRTRASKMCRKFNDLDEDTPQNEKQDLLRRLFGKFGEECSILPPLRCDYGKNTFIGDRVFMNFGTVILDTCKVEIGNDVLFGPNVCLFAATHPVDPEIRRNWGPELGKPIKIGNDVWIGGNCTILPGVTIGDGVTVGAGSVVTKDVEPYVVVAGNPAKVLRRLERREATSLKG
ncbi:uncharacterized protein SPPG_08301 [Spizellomyces punctatus DAOM BR117]|uniref:Maltose/galactoside acetyltransferase domain-containing protein n=1 Tax=Spizellomyces punctatus (strain DAOM BR117) TaxID=645134 RepID=A0A0L0H5A2_SPIPD|nr:uncharacterized protein SPPG_08301 [Spizellomyces punctatus DAOM BR117]KNC96402.1 hypothetical protein SPPG_08301 [Spizellomyces punctatus DAOM BR117]|eukprot:XP_016604442.1 hypothetical protein SPPG_08301 [Spizellomyces punctatus DAOM BR117]